MVKRRSKKNKSGTHGHGSSKKNRGAGNKGGRGNAGIGKKGHQKKQKADGKIHELGEQGFNSRSEPQEGINLRDLDQKIETFVEEGLAKETENGFEFNAKEAGYDKVLGKGKLTKKITIKAEKFSTTAENKIQESDSEAITLEE